MPPATLCQEGIIFLKINKINVLAIILWVEFQAE